MTVASLTKPHKRWICPLCGADVAARYEAKHSGSPECHLAQTVAAMAERDFKRCKGADKIISRAGIPLERAPAYIDRNAGTVVLVHTYWAPAFAVTVAQMQRDLSTEARHVILHHWSKGGAEVRGIFETLLAADATGVGVFLSALERGRCCDPGAKGGLASLWRRFELGKREQILAKHTGGDALRKLIG